MRVLRPHLAWLYVLLATMSMGQSPKSITYLRLSPQIVEKRLQMPATPEDWSDALRKQYLKAGIPPYQIVEQKMPGSTSQRMVMCSIKGRGENVIVVNASLSRPKDADAANVAWASLAMLPLLAESLNGVSTESNVIFIAFPNDGRHHSAAASYVRQLSEANRREIKAAVEISGVGRGRTTIEVKRGDRSLADWLATAALALQFPAPLLANESDTLNFTDARVFRSADVPAISVSSQPQQIPQSFSYSYKPLNKLNLYEYYNTYQLLCVFLLDLDRAPRGASPKSAIASEVNAPSRSPVPVFTIDEANAMIAGQINDERSRHGSRTLWWLGIPELQGLTCDMAHNGKLDPMPFQDLLKQKKLSGRIAVFSGDYPSLLPDQLQGFKIGRFQRIAVATCIVPSAQGKGLTYWIAALAYE